MSVVIFEMGCGASSPQISEPESSQARSVQAQKISEPEQKTFGVSSPQISEPEASGARSVQAQKISEQDQEKSAVSTTSDNKLQMKQPDKAANEKDAVVAVPSVMSQVRNQSDFNKELDDDEMLESAFREMDKDQDGILSLTEKQIATDSGEVLV